MRHAHPVGAGALITLLLAGPAGCTSGRHSSAEATTTSGASTTAPSTSLAAPPTTAGTTTSVSPSTAVTAQAGSPCQPSQLSIPQPRWNGAAGTAFYLFDIKNASGTSCQVGGFFGVSLYDPHGHLLTDNTVRSTTLPNESGPAAPLMLSPGSVAHFAVSFSETGATNTACSSIGSFHLIPPNTRTQAQVSMSPPPGTTYLYCPSPVQVSPTKPGPAPTS